MKDTMKTCQHSLSDDVIYKEVVIIGNGPSGMVTSYMLAGNVPYLKEIPDDLPIDEMLRARLSNLPVGQNLYEVDLLALAEGLEGRSQNPIPLLMDNLWRPCADMGIEADPLIEWRYDAEKQIEHLVLGRGPPGGAWHTFPPAVRTLSPAAWLSLPPHAPPPAASGRLSARQVQHYCPAYVTHTNTQRYYRNGVIVTRVTAVGPPAGAGAGAEPCGRRCPRHARFMVYGYDKSCGSGWAVSCARVVLATGAGDRPNTLAPHVARHALHSLHAVERALPMPHGHAHGHSHARPRQRKDALPLPRPPPPPGPGPGVDVDVGVGVAVLIVGSGVSAADAVRLCARRAARALHLYRRRAPALHALDASAYPDYTQVYKMMCDGPDGNYPNYTAYPDHVIVDVSPAAAPAHLAHPRASHRLKRVTLLDLITNETKIVTVSLITVLIGSKPDLFFLQTNFTLDCIETKCLKCTDEIKHSVKRKIEDDEQQCFLKNHWHYLKSVLGQSIQSCKSRYLNYTEINGNDTTCIDPDCKKPEKICTCRLIENGKKQDCKCEIIPYSDLDSKTKCTCEENPYSAGIGYGIDPAKPVDGRANPIAIDKGTHEVLNGPKGLYALGPITADNFVRFIPGGALALVSNIHKENKQL